MIEALIVAAVAFAILAAVIHNGLYNIAKEVAGTRHALDRTITDLEVLQVIFERIARGAGREIQTQQDIRDDRERRRRARLDKEFKESIASGRARSFDG